MRQKHIPEARDAVVTAIRSDSRVQVNQEAVDALVVQGRLSAAAARRTPPRPRRPRSARRQSRGFLDRRATACAPVRPEIRRLLLSFRHDDSRRRTAVLLHPADAAASHVRCRCRIATARCSSISSRASSRPAISAAPRGSRGRSCIRSRCSPSTTSCSRRFSAPASFDGKSFLLFVAVALWPWLAAQEGLARATVSLAGYAGLIRKVAFPHEIVVYASVGATLALQFAGYVVVLVALEAFGEPVHFEGLLVAVPLWIVLAIAVTGSRCCSVGAAGLHPRRRARADARADDHDVPDADPLSADAGARRRAAVGRGQSLRLARGAPARRADRRSSRAALERRRRARSRRSRSFLADDGCSGGSRRTSRIFCEHRDRREHDSVAAQARPRRQGLREGRRARRARSPRAGTSSPDAARRACFARSTA